MNEKKALLDWLNKQEHFRMSVIAKRSKMSKFKLSRLLAGVTQEFADSDYKNLLKACKKVGYVENNSLDNQ